VPSLSKEFHTLVAWVKPSALDRSCSAFPHPSGPDHRAAGAGCKCADAYPEAARQREAGTSMRGGCCGQRRSLSQQEPQQLQPQRQQCQQQQHQQQEPERIWNAERSPPHKLGQHPRGSPPGNHPRHGRHTPLLSTNCSPCRKMPSKTRRRSRMEDRQPQQPLPQDEAAQATAPGAICRTPGGG